MCVYTYMDTFCAMSLTSRRTHTTCIHDCVYGVCGIYMHTFSKNGEDEVACDLLLIDEGSMYVCI